MITPMQHQAPRFLLCNDMDDNTDTDMIFHTKHPRFIAHILPDNIDGLTGFRIDENEWLVVTTWIDQPDTDPAPLLKAAVDSFEGWNDRAIQAPGFF